MTPGAAAPTRPKREGQVIRSARQSPITHAEPLDFLERRALMGRDTGFVDVHLLASAALAAPARLWTRDRRLAAIAIDLNLAWE